MYLFFYYVLFTMFEIIAYSQSILFLFISIKIFHLHKICFLYFIKVVCYINVLLQNTGLAVKKYISLFGVHRNTCILITNHFILLTGSTITSTGAETTYKRRLKLCHKFEFNIFWLGTTKKCCYRSVSETLSLFRNFSYKKITQNPRNLLYFVTVNIAKQDHIFGNNKNVVFIWIKKSVWLGKLRLFDH